MHSPPTPETELAPAAALAWRVRCQGLAERRGPGAMLEVAAALGGVHAQLMSSAQLTLSARVDGLDPEAVARALWEQRTLVKTWAMRGTLHLLPAAELPLWQAALSTYRHFRRPSWHKAFGVSPEQLDALLDAIGDALDGRTLSREELATEVARLTGDPGLGEGLRESWGALLKPAAFLGRLCFAPGEGTQVRFTRPDTWLGGWEPEDPETALREVTRRFLAAQGAVTREQLARWWAGSPADATRMLQRLGDEVVPVRVGGEDRWMLRADAEPAAAAAPSGLVRLLPAFDQYVVAAPRDAPDVLAPAHRARVYRPQGWLSPVLLVDGRIEGVWRHERRGASLEVEVAPFDGPPGEDVRSGVEAETERLARHLGGEPALRWA